MDIESAFRAQILEKLGAAPSTVVADGKIHRFATKPNGRDDAGFYVLFDDGLPAGKFGDWRTGDEFKWNAKSASTLPPEDKKRIEELKTQRKARESDAYAKAAEAAQRRWSNANIASEDNAYLKRKEVRSHGLREAYGALLVPVYDGDTLISLQSIDADGSKLFAQGSRTKGGYFVIGNPSDVLVIAEGYATAATIYETTTIPVCVAFNAGNLVAVAKKMRERYPAARIIVASDDDYKTESERGFNPGTREATKAAEAVGGTVIVPPFNREDGDDGTDYNDLASLRGVEAVKSAFAANLAETSKIDATAEIARLAALDPMKYDAARASAAERLGCRVSTLDAEVEKVRVKREERKATAGLCADIEPWPSPVDVAELLDDVRSTIKRFIVCDGSTATAAALWVALTWIIEHAQVAPLAIITAPEKGCGKTQLLDVIGRLSRRPLFASNISAAATFRIIEAKTPTLLIDEADAFFRENEELRGVINSGHTRTSAYVIRTVGDDFEPKQFSTWGAKAIAGIGRLPETVMSRGIVLSLRRKLKTEKVERLRHAEPGLFPALASRLARFGQHHSAGIGRARPEIPDALDDRQGDNWESMLAIADSAGGSWPNDARRAALEICGADAETASTSEELLSDVRDIFDAQNVTRISMAELLRLLIEDETAPWATWNRGRPMSTRQLGSRLKEFGIKAATVAISHYDKPKGFKREQFADAWARYLDGGGDSGDDLDMSSPDTPFSPVTRSPLSVSAEKEVTEAVTGEKVTSHYSERSPQKSPAQSHANPKVSGQGDRVTDEPPPRKT
jgi:putative DNA primase/helicase